MWNNYFKIAFRKCIKHKGFSLLNVAGLSFGLVCFILISLYVRYEMSYDGFFDDADRIFRVASYAPESSYMGKNRFAVTPTPMAPALIQDFPEVETATRLTFPRTVLLGEKEEGFYARGFFADEHFLDVFSFKLISGDRKTALKDPHSVIISRDIADRFFKGENPVGKAILSDSIVTGVFEGIPENSHLQFDFLKSFLGYFPERKRQESLQNWHNQSFFTYIKLKRGVDIAAFQEKIKKLWDKYNVDDKESDYYLQPLKSIHTRSDINFEISANTNIRNIYLFSSIALLILIIACINTMNLATARASLRSREVGIRKVTGAHKSQLFRQFTAESLLTAFLSLVFALGIVSLLLPFFSTFVERQIKFSNIIHSSFLGVILGATFMTGILAGAYPALFLSSLGPVKAFRSTTGEILKKRSIHRILVVFQFTITIVLIASGLIVYKQIRFIRNRDIGYDREHTVVMRVRDSGIYENMDAFRSEIKKNPHVLGTTTSDSLPVQIGSAMGGTYDDGRGGKVSFHTHVVTADHDFLDVYRMEIIQGRNFSKEFATDAAEAVIVNETLVRQAGWVEPLGKKVMEWNPAPRKVVGVVKDFNFHSLRLDIKPLMIVCREDNYSHISIRISPDDIPGTIAHIRKTYEKFRKRFPFEYSFLDEVFNRMYKADEKLGELFGLFASLAVLIACLGLFGLAAHAGERRTKEIGIRKVLGASIPSILSLLSREFLKLVALANIFAWPAVYFFMEKWLDNFTFRTSLGIGVFLLSGLTAIFIALLTVGAHSLRIAQGDPVNSLRYD